MFNIGAFAIQDAKNLIDQRRAERSRSVGADDTFSSAVNQRLSESSIKDVDFMTDMISNELSPEVAQSYRSAHQEMEELFLSYRAAKKALSSTNPTPNDILDYIHQNARTLHITNLDSEAIRQLIDFFDEYSDDDEVISSDRSEADQEDAEILLGAILLSGVLRSKYKLDKKIKTEKKRAEARR